MAVDTENEAKSFSPKWRKLEEDDARSWQGINVSRFLVRVHSSGLWIIFASKTIISLRQQYNIE